MSLQPILFALAQHGGFESGVLHLATAIVAGVWQGFLLAAAIGVCLQVVPRTTARLRFAVWSMAFAALAAMPLLSAGLEGRSVTSSAAPSHLVQLDARWSYALAALWLVAVLIRAAHLALQAVKLRTLWRSAVPVSCELLPELALGKVKLCISTEVDRPSVIGFFSPRILVPAWLFDQLTPEELHQIVLHELEHLRRRDDWINLFQKIGLVLFPLNPALFWIDRRLASERELACDDGVLSRTHAPRAYATCLTSLAQRRLEHRRYNRLTMLALGALGAVRRSDFSRRIESILASGWRSTSSPAPARAVAAVLTAGVLGGAAFLAHAPQLVSFAAAPQTQTTAALPPVAQPVRANAPQPVRFENVVYHAEPVTSSPAARPAKRRVKVSPLVVASDSQGDTVYSESTPKQGRQMLRTSWQQSAPRPVIVTLPDGRTFLATYSADPYQPGWLLIQL